MTMCENGEERENFQETMPLNLFLFLFIAARLPKLAPHKHSLLQTFLFLIAYNFDYSIGSHITFAIVHLPYWNRRL